MRDAIEAIVEYENDDYIHLLKQEIVNTSIQFHFDIEQNKRTVFNFQTGELEEVVVEDKEGNKLAWLMNEYIGYTKENYPEIFDVTQGT